MLRTKLFLAFSALVVALGAMAAAIGLNAIRGQVVAQAQNRVSLDLGSAWTVYEAHLREMRMALHLLAEDPALAREMDAGRWDADAVKRRLASGRETIGLDFLGLADRGGQVRLRANAAGSGTGGSANLSVVAAALEGRPADGTIALGTEALDREAAGLSQQAAFSFQPTRRARPLAREQEDRGLVMVAAAPVVRDGHTLGVLYGGLLLNRNHALVDRMADLVYRGETHQGRSIGSATIFLDDGRIATTVRDAEGRRAVGTRASAEVAREVLGFGRPWIGRAFVVHDWYLTAYDPIRDPDGVIVGMLYVGLLEQPYREMARRITLRFVLLMGFGLLASLALAYGTAGWLARPIHCLAETARSIRGGADRRPVRTAHACREIGELVRDFNDMTAALDERETRLQEANARLQALNQGYMEMLGFVSHELKSPVAASQNYLYLLAHEKLGPLSGPQRKAIGVLDRSNRRMAEMVRHYLNLSRIESGSWSPAPEHFALRPDILEPTVEGLQGDLDERGMRIVMDMDGSFPMNADPDQMREVFENLLGNAVKYGREGGEIRIAARRIEDGSVSLTVRNEGEGIPPERFDDVFGKFVRLEEGGRSGRNPRRGTGLGLFITRHIVEAHGGRIVPASEPGRWVEFRLDLPQPG